MRPDLCRNYRAILAENLFQLLVGAAAWQPLDLSWKNYGRSADGGGKLTDRKALKKQEKLGKAWKSYGRSFSAKMGNWIGEQSQIQSQGWGQGQG